MACVKHENVIQYRPDILQTSKKTAKQLYTNSKNHRICLSGHAYGAKGYYKQA